MLFAYFYLLESRKISTASTKNDSENKLTKAVAGDMIKTLFKLGNSGGGGRGTVGINQAEQTLPELEGIYWSRF